MPSIPSYAPKVQEQAMPGVRVSENAPAEAFGAGQSNQQLNQAITGTAKEWGQTIYNEKVKADDTFVQNLEDQSKQYKNHLVYNDKDGLITKKEANAIGAHEDYQPKFSKYNDELAATAKNETQRSMFSKARSQQESDLSDTISRHLSKELEDYKQSSFKNGVSVSIDDAISNYQKPGYVDQAIRNQNVRIQDYAKHNGLPPEEETALSLAASTKVHEGVIGRMIAQGLDQAAEGYYKKYSNQINGTSKDNIEKALEIGSTLGGSQRAASTIMASYGDNEAEALKAARNINNPKLQEATVKQVKERFQEVDSAKKQAENVLMDKVFNQIDESGKRPDNMTYAILSPEGKKQADAYYEHRSKATEPNTDWKKFTDLMIMADTPALREQFLKIDPWTYRDSLGDSEYKKLVTVQGEMRKKNPKAEQEANGYRSATEVVNRTLVENGIPIPKTNDKGTNVTRYNDLMRNLDLKVSEYKEVNKTQKIPTEELQKIVDSLVISGKVEGSGLFGFFQSNVKPFEKEPGQKLKFDKEATFKDIPSVDKMRITAMLRAKNKQVSQDAIVRIYNYMRSN